MNVPTSMFQDPSVRAILAANGLALLFALLFNWRMLHLLWPFWIQSVIIGVFAFRRIIASGSTRRPPDWRLDPGRRSEATGTALFFALHYGAFHALYAFFLFAMVFDAADGVIQVRYANTGEIYPVEVGQVGPLDLAAFVVLAVGFWRAHAQSAQHHLERDLLGTLSPGQFAALPYLRVLPMHLTLLFGIGLAMFTGLYLLVTLLFVLLKTAADVGMHVIEHKAALAELSKTEPN